MSNSFAAKLIQQANGPLARAGLSLIPTWRLGHLAQERYLRRLLERLAIDCVLDVGANQGQYRDFLRERVGYGGHIVSFEPVPDNVAVLHDRAKADPRWTIEDCALGAEAGHTQFNVMASSVFSSFLTPDASQTNAFEQTNRVERVIQVEVKRLADVLPPLLSRLGCRRPYLKLDTQGYDLQVVAGAGERMADVLALQAEASVTPIYAGMPDYVTTIRTLETHGFQLAGMFPVDPDALVELVEFDCHMVNKRWAHASEAGADPLTRA